MDKRGYWILVLRHILWCEVYTLFKTDYQMTRFFMLHVPHVRMTLIGLFF